MLVVCLKQRSFLRLECELNVLNSSQQPVRLTASSKLVTEHYTPVDSGGGGAIEFISGGNIFQKLLNKSMERKSAFRG